MKKRGAILVENIIFIVLNLIFLTILVLFVYSKAGGAVLLEESYAKNIALLIDSANPGKNGIDIYLNMEKGIEKATKEEWGVEKVVSIDNNIIRVKTTKDSGYEYVFFNDVSVSAQFDKAGKKGFFFTVNKKGAVSS
jgi:hypothetical protein